jgi:hypothetical protein
VTCGGHDDRTHGSRFRVWLSRMSGAVRQI